MLDSLTPEEVYAILCARIKNTALGLGAVKGAPCTISSIKKEPDGNLVTFQWTGTNGKVQTSTMKVKDGRSITNVDASTGRLVVTFSDGTTQDAGAIGSGSGLGSGDCDPDNCECIRYSHPGSSVAVGGIKQGEKFDNVKLQDVIDKLLSAPYTGPQVTISLSCKNLYAVEDVGTISLPVVITAKATKRTDDIKDLKFYVDNVLIDTKTSGVANGGTFTTNYNVSITKTTIFKVVVSDGKSSATATATVTVVNSSYVGYVPDGTNVDASVVKSLTKVVKTSKAYKYDNILMPSTNTFHIVYAYPKSFGTITTIKDGMNFEYIQDYILSEIVIDGANYYVYKLRTPTCVTLSGFYQNFA